jgi:hypothetical protein
MGKEGYCLLYKQPRRRLPKLFLKRVYIAPIQRLIACRAAAPEMPPDKRSPGKNSGESEECSALICHDYPLLLLLLYPLSKRERPIILSATERLSVRYQTYSEKKALTARVSFPKDYF